MDKQTREKAFDLFFNHIRKRPGMFIPGEDYEHVASFIVGMDVAYSGEWLKGFNEWAQERRGERSCLCWSAYLKETFEKPPESEQERFGTATEFLFEEIGRFLKRAR